MQRDEATHERLAERLANILTQLNMGQQLSIKELASEFKVSTRTISRDFDRLSASLPLVKDDTSKKYYLPMSYLGKVTPKDIRNFAQLSGIRDLYPSLDISFLRELLDHCAQQTYSTRGYPLEDASQFQALFKVFSTAIQQYRQVFFLYRGESKCVSPYRLIHHHGNWYLAATFTNKLRAYRLSRIELLPDQSMCTNFEVDPAVLAQLENEETIWFGQEKTEVILRVDAEVATHFQARALLPEQQVIKSLEDGGLFVSSRIVHTKQILPLVRYWLPHLKIISPERLQDEMEQGLKKYLRIQ